MAGSGWFWVAMVGLGWLQMFLSGWFWMAGDGSGCLQMVLGEFRWFSYICSFSSYGEIRCFKFKRNRQLWEVFVVSSNNDTKVFLKQITKFLGNSKYNVSLKKSLSFFLWKLTYISLCKLSRFWLQFSPFWRNSFKDILIWPIIGWQVCILGWVSDKLSYLLKSCCNYIFRVSIIFGHYLCSRNLRKKSNFDLSKNHKYTFL